MHQTTGQIVDARLDIGGGDPLQRIGQFKTVVNTIPVRRYQGSAQIQLREHLQSVQRCDDPQIID